jgi:hypothetical protein
MTVTTPPRKKSAVWEVGDPVNIGPMRWVIRTINGENVELESMNQPNASIWWTTTLLNLPRKDA